MVSHDDSQQSDLPDWVSQYQSPVKATPPVPSSSSEGLEILESDAEEQTQPPKKSTPQSGAKKRKRASSKGSQDATDDEPLGSLPDGTTGEAARTALPKTNKSEVDIIMPDKLPQNKILMELRAHGDTPATDLSGDAGAVGRMLVSGKPGSEEVKVDLKGVIYSAVTLPLPGCAFVLNIGATEAKVEMLVHDFISLREEVNQDAANGVMEGDFGDLGSDEENYQLGGEGDDGPSEKRAKKKDETKAAAKKPAKPRKPSLFGGKPAGGTKRASSKSSKPKSAGGAKKPAKKPPKPKK